MKKIVKRKSNAKISRTGRVLVSARRKANSRKCRAENPMLQFPSYPRIFHFIISLLLFIFVSPLNAQMPASCTMNWSKAGVVGRIHNFTIVVNAVANGWMMNDNLFDNSVPLQTMVDSKAGTSMVIPLLRIINDKNETTTLNYHK